MEKWYSCLILLCGFSVNLFAQPVINSYAPAAGPVGSKVVISGSNFSPAPSSNIVYFGAVRAQVSAASASSLTVTVPAGATYQPISVTTGHLTAYSSGPFSVIFAGAGDLTYNSFLSQIDTTDLHPNGMVLIDFDGDGKPDLATANNYSTLGTSASVSVLHNTSSGGFISFAPRADLPTGIGTYAIAAGDLDGDGMPDMVSSSVGNQTISVFRNTSTPGAIAFAGKIDYAVGQSPFSIAIGDLDGDGKPDIVVGNSLSNSLSIFKNSSTPGNISFAARVDIPTALFPQNIALGDIDGDGKPDLVVVNLLSNSFSVFRNTSSPGTISFSARVDVATGADNPFGLAIGDIDGDGKADVVITNNNYTSVTPAAISMSIFRNLSSPGSISFASPFNGNGSGNAYNPAITDINGDGYPDIVVPSFSGQTYVYESISTPGKFAFPVLSGYAGLSPYTAVAGDLDGDGITDMAVSNFTLNSVSVFKNVMKAPKPYSFYPTSGNPGAVISISGVNFTGATGVSFGGTPASSFTVVDGTTISATVGAGSSGNIAVTNPFGTVGISGFTFTGPPSVTSFFPISADSGLTVTITGTNFTGVTGVFFDGTPALSFNVVSPSVIEAVVGNGNSGNLSVSTSFGTGFLPGFVVAPPVITSFIPNAAGAGDSVTINGMNLSGVQAVFFGGAPATAFRIISPTEIVATLPGGSSGAVSVQTVRSVSMPGFAFLAPPPPVINSVTPDSSLVGSAITLAGTNFNSFPSGNIVYFGAVKATVNSATASSLTVVVPPEATAEPVSLLNTANGLSGYATQSFFPTLPITMPIDSSLFDTTVQIAGASESAQVCDFDGDGKADIALMTNAQQYSSLSQWDVTVFRNTGTPGNIAFDKGLQFPVSSIDNVGAGGNMVAVDLDGDGKKDIVALNDLTSYGNASTVAILQNLSSPGHISFANQVEYVSFGAKHVFVADLDGDGRPDIITSGIGGATTMQFFLNASTVDHIVLGNPINYNPPGTPLGFMDFNGDGKPDMLFSNGLSAGIALNTSVGDSISFSSPFTIYSTVYDHFISGAAIGDIDGDGKPDIFLANSATSQGSFAVLRNTSTNLSISFADTNYLVSGKPFFPLLADVNGDGKPDLIAADYVSPTVFSIYENLSARGSIALAPGQYYFSFPNSYLFLGGAFAADFDGDGKTDLADFADGYILKNTMSEVPKIFYQGSTTFCQGDSLVLTASTPDSDQWYRNNAVIPGATASQIVVRETGTYSVTSNVKGIPLPPSLGVTVTVNPVPPKPTIMTDSKNELVSSDSIGNQWYIDTSTAIAGATFQVYKPAARGLYAVQVSQNGCLSPFSDPIQYINLPNGTIVTVTPDPARTYITVNFNTMLTTSILSGELLDFKGNVTLRLANVQNGQSIYIGNLTAGVYILKLFSSDGRINANIKFLKL
jgi:hypothetical protein